MHILFTDFIKPLLLQKLKLFFLGSPWSENSVDPCIAPAVHNYVAVVIAYI